ncbi:MAG: EAL domain-containing protein [Nitrospiraceae bacterium]|nr:MAG: EAL domain-containing protein [Nitrospiraceae bacterium]
MAQKDTLDIKSLQGKSKAINLFLGLGPLCLSLIVLAFMFFAGLLIPQLSQLTALSPVLRQAVNLSAPALVIIFFALYFLFRLLLSKASECQRLEDRGLLAYNVLDSSNNPILITDAQANIEYVNPAFCFATGYAKEELIGQKPNIMKSGKHNREFYMEMWKTIKETGRWQGEIWDKRKNGDIYPKWLSISAIKNSRGETVKYSGLFSDITALKQTEEQIEHLSNYDSLTNLPNRRLFLDRLNQALLGAERNNRALAVMFVDINRFKNINNTFGHSAGDQLIKEFSKRVSGCMRKEDTVGHISGNSFAIILPAIEGKESAEVVSRKIIDSMLSPFILKGHKVIVSASIGIALYPLDSDKLEMLIKNAETAMYNAKEHGDNRIQFYNNAMGDMTFQRLSIEANIREALEREEFVLYYQPVVNLNSGMISGMEALIRRQEPEWVAPPSKFIELAEETGLILQICEWTLRKACRQNKLWQAEGLPPMHIAVNIASSQFYEGRLIKTVTDVLRETGLEPKYLELELIERLIMQDSAASINMMQDLKKLGTMISVDDFGTGYSSLNYLRLFPVDKLKIDQSFVRDIAHDSSSASISKAIIALAHSLNLKTVAEGVETEAQLSFLRECGCDEMQGYYFSVPLPAESFKKLVLSGKKIRYQE